MNPYLIIGALVAAIAIGAGGYYTGRGAGVDAQKALDQREFDKINAERTTQKAEANERYRQAQDDIIALQVERDQLKNDLRKKRENDRKATDDKRGELAGLGLRFRPGQGAGDRADGCGAQAPGAGAAIAATPAAVELPKQITSDLRLLAFDADKLADDYRECHGYASKVK